MDRNVKSARESLQACVAVGLILGLIGGVVMGLAWPGEEIGSLGSVTETGSPVLAAIGAVVAWAGNVLLAVGLVGYGVMLGRQASPPAAAAEG